MLLETSMFFKRFLLFWRNICHNFWFVLNWTWDGALWIRSISYGSIDRGHGIWCLLLVLNVKTGLRKARRLTWIVIIILLTIWITLKRTILIRMWITLLWTIWIWSWISYWYRVLIVSLYNRIGILSLLLILRFVISLIWFRLLRYNPLILFLLLVYFCILKRI